MTHVLFLVLLGMSSKYFMIIGIIKYTRGKSIRFFSIMEIKNVNITKQCSY